MKQPELGRKILELRQARGLTQSELAETCNLSLRTVQRIESAETTPRNYTSRTILSRLGYEWTDLQEDPGEREGGGSGNVKGSSNKRIDTAVILLGLLSLAGLAFAGLLIFRAGNNQQQTENDPQPVQGWLREGDNYRAGLDKTIRRTGGKSVFLECTESRVDKDEFGTLLQSCSTADYAGKRVRMTSYIRSKKVKGWAGMWMRADTRGSYESLAFDNMSDRPIKGTSDWTRCEIVLDVPEDSSVLFYGILLAGTGKIWFDDVKLEIVDNDVPTTRRPLERRKQGNQKSLTF